MRVHTVTESTQKPKGVPILTESAPAKINLGLKVLGRRDDGFHNLLSVCQTVDLCDRLEFHDAEMDSLTCSDPSLPSGRDNLALRALCAFRKATPELETPPLHIHLRKAIPAGAGLGGGSADAAAVLRALDRWHGRMFDLAFLCEIGATIGSDVPFCVRGGTARMRGRGEIIETLSWDSSPAFHAVVCDPGVHVSTAWAYAQLRPAELTINSPYATFVASLGGGRVNAGQLLEVLENDFQPVVERAKPIVADVKEALLSAGASAASMTGSGSAVYGIFDDRIAAASACQTLKDTGIRTFLCTPQERF